MKSHFATIALLALLGLGATSVTPAAAPPPGRFRAVTMRNGGPNSDGTAILDTATGCLWLVVNNPEPKGASPEALYWLMQGPVFLALLNYDATQYAGPAASAKAALLSNAEVAAVSRENDRVAKLCNEARVDAISAAAR